MTNHNKLNYLEIPAKEIDKTKEFFSEVFNWKFVDYGPEYTCFIDAGIDGGFYKFDKTMDVSTGSPLIIIYSEELEKTESNIVKAGGVIIKPIYSFPGGRRFHFREPSGNEFAVWS